jgi:hypothetical protein
VFSSWIINEFFNVIYLLNRSREDLIFLLLLNVDLVRRFARFRYHVDKVGWMYTQLMYFLWTFTLIFYLSQMVSYKPRSNEGDGGRWGMGVALPNKLQQGSWKSVYGASTSWWQILCVNLGKTCLTWQTVVGVQCDLQYSLLLKWMVQWMFGTICSSKMIQLLAYRYSMAYFDLQEEESYCKMESFILHLYVYIGLRRSIELTPCTRSRSSCSMWISCWYCYLAGTVRWSL